MDENLDEILLGGQTFSWRKAEDGTFQAALNGRVYRIKSIDDCQRDNFLRRYFDLDFDYDTARKEIMDKDDILRKAVERVGKIRILKQDEWTCAISFILSQNNNIKRITSLYNKISEKYGRKIEEGFYSFPSPDDMKDATEEELRMLGVGFRAPFILSAIEHKDIFEEVKSLDFDSALSKLETIKGIGVKVASCILIFGYGRKDGFPIDTWIKKCLEMFYRGVDTEYFAPHKALCQQYLFSYMRMKDKNK